MFALAVSDRGGVFSLTGISGRPGIGWEEHDVEDPVTPTGDGVWFSASGVGNVKLRVAINMFGTFDWA
jgi:hypothetical protein